MSIAKPDFNGIPAGSSVFLNKNSNSKRTAKTVEHSSNIFLNANSSNRNDEKADNIWLPPYNLYLG